MLGGVGCSFVSVRVRKFQEWWKFGSTLRSWNGQLVDPWKTDEPPTPLRSIPGVDSPLLIRTDPAHTWPIGVGKEFAASTIFLLCHLNVWPANNMPDKLLGAWEHFQSWRYRTKHTSKLHEFTYKTFKVQSSTGYNFVSYWNQMFLHVGHGNLNIFEYGPRKPKAFFLGLTLDQGFSNTQFFPALAVIASWFASGWNLYLLIPRCCLLSMWIGGILAECLFLCDPGCAKRFFS